MSFAICRCSCGRSFDLERRSSRHLQKGAHFPSCRAARSRGARNHAILCAACHRSDCLPLSRAACLSRNGKLRRGRLLNLRGIVAHVRRASYRVLTTPRLSSDAFPPPPPSLSLSLSLRRESGARGRGASPLCKMSNPQRQRRDSAVHCGGARASVRRARGKFLISDIRERAPRPPRVKLPGTR